MNRKDGEIEQHEFASIERDVKDMEWDELFEQFEVLRKKSGISIFMIFRMMLYLYELAERMGRKNGFMISKLLDEYRQRYFGR